MRAWAAKQPRTPVQLTLGGVATATHRLEVGTLWQEHLVHLAAQPGATVPQVGWGSWLMAHRIWPFALARLGLAWLAAHAGTRGTGWHLTCLFKYWLASLVKCLHAKPVPLPRWHQLTHPGIQKALHCPHRPCPAPPASCHACRI